MRLSWRSSARRCGLTAICHDWTTFSIIPGSLELPVIPDLLSPQPFLVFQASVFSVSQFENTVLNSQRTLVSHWPWHCLYLHIGLIPIGLHSPCLNLRGGVSTAGVQLVSVETPRIRGALKFKARESASSQTQQISTGCLLWASRDSVSSALSRMQSLITGKASISSISYNEESYQSRQKEGSENCSS